MVIPLWVIPICSRLCGNLVVAKCWFNELGTRDTQHQKLGHPGSKWLEMRVHHLKNKNKQTKNQDKYLSAVLLKDSSSQTRRNHCKTNMLAATVHVSSFLCSVCQGKKKRFMTHCFPRLLLPLQIFTGWFLEKQFTNCPLNFHFYCRVILLLPNPSYITQALHLMLN